MSFDSITNRGEYFSEHYLDAVIQSDLEGLRKSWKEAEGKGEATPRSGLKSLRAPLSEARAAIEDDVEGAQETATEAVLQGLGFEPDWTTLNARRGEGAEVSIPIVAHASRLGSPPELIVLGAEFATDVDSLLSGAGDDDFEKVNLVRPLSLDGEEYSEPSRAVSLIFETDDPPRHVLVVAGAIVLLASRGKWAEGRFLAANLDIALERADDQAKGEIETIAAIFGFDSLVTRDDEAEALIEDLDAKSLRNAAGVSEDLREGVRLAVEDIANEVIDRRREGKLVVYDDPDFAEKITRETLRFLYRILFLLYAESRPELNVVPAAAEGYAQGYGIDRLRELALEEPQEEQSRNGTHIHQSLDLLFDLVNEGHRHLPDFEQGQIEQVTADDTGFTFNPLESDLFEPDATPLISSVRMRNFVLCRVLERLLLTREGGGDRRFISYSALGINQLGAVYEQLMAYTGFLAAEDLYEIRELDKNGAQKKDGGTWVVPVSRADEFPDDAFVTKEDLETGEQKKVPHPKGTFVFRLSGRQRQRSASYYTPEILTEFVVRHSLEELLDRDGEKTIASDMLNLTVCEPALGSGAFLNEAINQLSSRYLQRRQEELGEVIPPENYPSELQKVKAHFALHQAYGVDLNATAVELAEVSLWLNAMHPGLRAPWFGLHLQRGNSLVGARRSVYEAEDLVKKVWLKKVPTDRKLADGQITKGEIHSFLLPADGWGSVGKTKEAKELEPEKAQALRDWVNRVKRGPTKREAGRLAALARRVEGLWALAIERLHGAERDLRRELNLYGQDAVEADASGSSDLATRKAVEAALDDGQSALHRLRLAMDAWCAMWFWPLDKTPPEWEEWLEMLEALLGVETEDPESLPENPSFEDLPALLQREELEQEKFGMLDLDQVREKFGWLATVDEIEAREGFFHWELEFSHILKKGGFDLQVGNPPWVRPRWLDDQMLAESDPWFGLSDESDPTYALRRMTVLSEQLNRWYYLGERTSAEGLSRFLSTETTYPWLKGLQSNLYQAFMVQVWRIQNKKSIAGLIHQDSHFTAPGGGGLRSGAYRRLLRYWHFVNESKLFVDVHHDTDFGVHIYGQSGPVGFLMATSLQVPSTLDRSFSHDGIGNVPGIKSLDGSWDRTPHRSRVFFIDMAVLRSWAKLFDEPGIAPIEARLMRPHASEDVSALGALSEATRRVRDASYAWSSGLHETGERRAGTIARHTQQPSTWGGVVLQGTHFSMGCPFSEQPQIGATRSSDREPWDLESLETDAIPRTFYSVDETKLELRMRDSPWFGRSPLRDYRVIHRVMTKSIRKRTFHAALIPPGPTHVHACHSFGFESRREIALFGAYCVSMPFDFLVKVSAGGANHALVSGLPFPELTSFEEAQLLRVLRLNCLTSHFAELWEELWSGAIEVDRWTSSDPRLGELAKGRRWDRDTPLRIDIERRQAFVELDALAAIALGLTADQLCAIYRTQFGVLRADEFEMRHDANGREVPKSIWKAHEKDPEGADLGRYEIPFTAPDREVEMRAAYAEFERRAAA